MLRSASIPTKGGAAGRSLTYPNVKAGLIRLSARRGDLLPASTVRDAGWLAPQPARLVRNDFCPAILLYQFFGEGKGVLVAGEGCWVTRPGPRISDRVAGRRRPGSVLRRKIGDL